jgi:hypothetical protein
LHFCFNSRQADANTNKDNSSVAIGVQIASQSPLSICDLVFAACKSSLTFLLTHAACILFFCVQLHQRAVIERDAHHRSVNMRGARTTIIWLQNFPHRREQHILHFPIAPLGSGGAYIHDPRELAGRARTCYLGWKQVFVE